MLRFVFRYPLPAITYPLRSAAPHFRGHPITFHCYTFIWSYTYITYKRRRVHRTQLLPWLHTITTSSHPYCPPCLTGSHHNGAQRINTTYYELRTNTRCKAGSISKFDEGNNRYCLSVFFVVLKVSTIFCIGISEYWVIGYRYFLFLRTQFAYWNQSLIDLVPSELTKRNSLLIRWSSPLLHHIRITQAEESFPLIRKHLTLQIIFATVSSLNTCP